MEVNNLSTSCILLDSNLLKGVLLVYQETILEDLTEDNCLKINLKESTQERPSYWTTLARSLVKTFKASLFDLKDDKKKVSYSFEIIIENPDYELNYYGILGRILSDYLKITELFIDEVLVQENNCYKVVKTGELSDNCFKICYNNKTGKIIFLEKSRGNLNKSNLLLFCDKLDKSKIISYSETNLLEFSNLIGK